MVIGCGLAKSCCFPRALRNERISTLDGQRHASGHAVAAVGCRRDSPLTCVDGTLMHPGRTADVNALAPTGCDVYGSTTSCVDGAEFGPQFVAGVHSLSPGCTHAGSGIDHKMMLTRMLGRWREMYCPYCHHSDSRVVDSRAADDGAAIRRRRQCPKCGRRFTTVETAAMQVVKRSGVQEPFARTKVVAGVRKACQGRPVSDDDLAFLAQTVEDAVRASGNPEVSSHEVGLAILGPLRELDEVAYLRFASVYRNFDSLADFEAEVSLLRAERDITDRANAEKS